MMVIRSGKTLLFGLLYFILFSVSAQKTKNKFIYGICGHPLTQEAYSKNVDLQLSIVKNIHCSFYRVDIPIDSTGTVVDLPSFKVLLQKSTRQGIRILPVLVFSKQQVYGKISVNELYQSGYAYGRNFAKKFKQNFTYYEIGNEEDNNLILPQRHGSNVTDFDTNKAATIMAYFRGVCNGIKKEDPSAKLIINHVWVHWGFLELLKSYNVNYDIVGLHWYSDMADLQNANGDFRNVLNDLSRRFKKKIWITEFNIKNGTSYAISKANTDWFARNIKYAVASKSTEALFVYELFDEPAFSNKESPAFNPNESTYGIGAWQKKYSNLNQKPLFPLYRSLIRSNP